MIQKLSCIVTTKPFLSNRWGILLYGEKHMDKKQKYNEFLAMCLRRNSKVQNINNVDDNLKEVATALLNSVVTNA